MAWLTDPWAEEIIRRAFLEVVLLGVASGALGCWIVLYGLSYSAESLAHGMFPGLVIAALLGIPLIVGGAIGIVIAALAVALVGRFHGLDRDVGVAVVVTTLFGAGVLLALSDDSPPGLGNLLFGDVLGVSNLDLAFAGALVLALAIALPLLHGRLLAIGFDRGSAQLLGIRSLPIDAVLLVLIAAAIVVAAQGLGNLLVVALLVAPAATARLITKRAPAMILVATGVAVAAGIAGLYASYHAGIAAGAAIAGALVTAYVATAAVAAMPAIPKSRKWAIPAEQPGP